MMKTITKLLHDTYPHRYRKVKIGLYLFLLLPHHAHRSVNQSRGAFSFSKMTRIMLTFFSSSRKSRASKESQQENENERTNKNQNV